MPSSYHRLVFLPLLSLFSLYIMKMNFLSTQVLKIHNLEFFIFSQNYFLHYFLIKLDISFLVNLSIGLGNVQSFLPFLKPFSNCIFCLSSHFYFFLFSIPLAFSSPYTFFCLLFIGYFFFHLFLLLAKA